MSTIAVIDDDLAMDLLTEALHFRGNEAFRITSVAEALKDLQRLAHCDPGTGPLECIFFENSVA